MSLVYWSIPLFVVAILVAVVPVTYGTLKHQQWEEASLAQSSAAHYAAVRTHVPVVAGVSDTSSTLEFARQEAIALLARLEMLRDFVAHEEALARDGIDGESAISTAS